LPGLSYRRRIRVGSVGTVQITPRYHSVRYLIAIRLVADPLAVNFVTHVRLATCVPQVLEAAHSTGSQVTGMPKIPSARKLRALVLQVFGTGPSAVSIDKASLDGLEKGVQPAENEVPSILPVVIGGVGRFLQVLGNPLI